MCHTLCRSFTDTAEQVKDTVDSLALVRRMLGSAAESPHTGLVTSLDTALGATMETERCKLRPSASHQL